MLPSHGAKAVVVNGQAYASLSAATKALGVGRSTLRKRLEQEAAAKTVV